MTLQTGMDYLMDLPILDLYDTIKEVAEIVDERKRISAGNQNRRKNR